jgi:4-alpha-glucanotransferase
MRPRLGTRASGVLLHPTSLPGPHGSGDLGPEAHRFVDFLARARQRWWQMLPVVPPGAGNSPYQSISAFAGSPLLISLDGLVRRGLLKRHELVSESRLEPGRVRYPAVRRFRERALRIAFERFEVRRSRQRGFEAFCARSRDWLDDFALFRALRDAHGGVPWTAWEPELRTRRASALARARHSLSSRIRYHQFVQLEFHRQWSALRRHCGERGVSLIGDLPIFVAHNSADVWAHQELFRLDRNGRRSVQAGVPPDYFSATGQLWGNPIYRWDAMRARGYDWWLARLRTELARFDAVRLDHFIGFQNYWEVPRRARTARNGRWVLGPGAHFFGHVFRTLGKLQLIAEDLGVVTPQVEALRDRFSLPGMKVLHFAFAPQAEASRPHHFQRNAVVYTGTHDNDTTRGWFRSLDREQRELVRTYLDSNGRQVHWDLIRLAWLSPPHTAIVPAQDLLGLGASARMNRPARPSGNWAWRVSAGALAEPLAERLGDLTSLYGRAVGSRARR